MSNLKENIIKEKTFSFSLSIIELYKKMLDQNEYVLSKQLLRSATSIGANVYEATAAQSRKDFISKMSIASKEARETNYWLRLISASNIVSINVSTEIDSCNEIVRILTSIVKTSQDN
jgi:four helix bundle protein